MPLMTPIALKIFCLESCCCSATQLCLTLCDPMDCSTPSFPVFPCLLEFAQTHVHWVDDDIQPSHPSPPSFNISQNQGKISSESAVHIRWPQYWSFNFSISLSNEYSGLLSFRMDWFDLAVQGTLKSLLQHYNLKASLFRQSASFWSKSHIHTQPLEKPSLWGYRPLRAK